MKLASKQQIKRKTLSVLDSNPAPKTVEQKSGDDFFKNDSGPNFFEDDLFKGVVFESNNEVTTPPPITPVAMSEPSLGDVFSGDNQAKGGKIDKQSILNLYKNVPSTNVFATNPNLMQQQPPQQQQQNPTNFHASQMMPQQAFAKQPQQHQQAQLFSNNHNSSNNNNFSVNNFNTANQFPVNSMNLVNMIMIIYL